VGFLFLGRVLFLVGGRLDRGVVEFGLHRPCHLPLPHLGHSQLAFGTNLAFLFVEGVDELGGGDTFLLRAVPPLDILFS